MVAGVQEGDPELGRRELLFQERSTNDLGWRVISGWMNLPLYAIVDLL
jgi:hypothetical protein